MTKARAADIDDLRSRFAAHGQEHVFAFWDELDAGSRTALGSQAARIAEELGDLILARDKALGQTDDERGPAIEPVDAIELPRDGGDSTRFEAARARGEAMLADGRVAAFVVAGGQGTRLGFDAPKGAYPVGPVTDRSLFAIQAQKIRGLIRRLGRPVPWYVMTSEATDAETRALFEAENHFGLSENDVWIFPQAMVPAFDFAGRLILEAPHRIFESPDGHGGSLTALAASGALDDMERRGIDTIFYYQVDNPLVRIGDPVYLGFHDERSAEMSCKVVRKIDPMEKVGIVARVDGDVGIVEYTELDDERRFARNEAGELLYWAGNLAIHVLNTGFVRRVSERAFELLPFHASAKKIPCIDAEARLATPEEPNGVKLERFVFDALASAKQVCVLEASAKDEFSPIKNATGNDSPDSCRQDLTAQYRRWLESAGTEVAADIQQIEIDHSIIDGPEDAAKAAFRNVAEAGDVIRVASGMGQ
ncbi:MAG: UDPGP type 1 family protein [Deltaproteobacteria bacterium]|nr:UDPGP type 1 family protein [Deltaproteobacteria bacterium]